MDFRDGIVITQNKKHSMHLFIMKSSKTFFFNGNDNMYYEHTSAIVTDKVTITI